MRQARTFPWALATILLAGCGVAPQHPTPDTDASSPAPPSARAPEDLLAPEGLPALWRGDTRRPAQDVPASRDATESADTGAALDDGGRPTAPPSDAPATPVEDLAPTPAEDVPSPEDGPVPPPDLPAPARDAGSPVDAPAPEADVVVPRDIPIPVFFDVVIPPRDVPPPPPDVPPPPRDVPPSPADVGDPNTGGGTSPFASMTGVPRIDASLKATLRAIYLRGVANGLRPNVFAKVGDSITESEHYLWNLVPASDRTPWEWGTYAALEPTRAFFAATRVDDRRTSFDRESVATSSGWTTIRAVSEGESLIRQELRNLRPAAALVMFGSGDTEVTDVGTFRSNLARILQIVMESGTIPIVSAIPDRIDTPTTVMTSPAFVVAVREVAAAQRVPLQDLWRALQPLPNRGLAADGVHPSVYRVGGATAPAHFTPAGLANGYNTYNLLTLATLAHVRAVVFDDGAPDP